MRAGDAQAHRAQDGSAEREGGHLPGATEDRGAFSKARKPEARPLAQPATLVGEEGRFHRPQPSLGASLQPAGPHASWSLAACRPSVSRSPPGPRAPRPPRAGLPGAGGAGGRPRCPPGGRGKCYFCLLLSSGTGSPGRGPEAAAAARPRPPGVFERCSWVLGGWQTWQRRVGRAPEPTTKKGGGWPNERRGRRRRRTPERLATQRQPKRTPGAAGPGASRPCRRAGSPSAMLQPPACPGPLRGWDSWPRSLQYRGRIVPTSGKPAASTRLLPCRGLGSPHPSTPWSSWGVPVLMPKKTAGFMAVSPATGLKPRAASHVPLGKAAHNLPQPQFPRSHREERARFLPLTAGWKARGSGHGSSQEAADSCVDRRPAWSPGTSALPLSLKSLQLHQS